MSQAAALMAAAPFVNPWLLGGLGLVALPIIIHLLSRRQFRVVPWAAIRFVLEAEKRNRRRARFEQWLLLALRCAAMALLALLVARPFMEPGVLASLIGARDATHRLIVIDDSFSLGFRQGAAQDFSTLLEAADRLLAWLRQQAGGDRVTLLLTSAPDAPLADDIALNGAALEELRAKVRDLKPGVIAAAPRGLLDKVTSRIGALAERGSVDMFIFSDFQRSEWEGAGPTEPVFAPLQQYAARLRVILVASGVAPRNNLAVTDLKLERPQTVAGMPAVAVVTIANFASTTARDVPLHMSIGGAVGPPTMVDVIEPGQRKTVSTEVTFPDEGSIELTARVDGGDGAAADDVRRITVAVRRAISALLVNGQPMADPARDEVFYLRSALTPTGPFASGVEVEVVDPPALVTTPIEKHQCVMICNLAAPSDSQVEWLERFVAQGGGLAIFLGDQVGEPEAYNTALFKAGGGLLPVELGAVQRAAGDATVGLIRAVESPISGLLPADSTGQQMARFSAYYTSRPATAEIGDPARPAAQTLATYSDTARSPALVERPYGAGRVLLVTSTADVDWNTWARAADGSYVVTMLEVLQTLARRDRAPSSFVAGAELISQVSPEEHSPEAIFRPPTYPNDPAVPAVARAPTVIGESIELIGPRATTLGVYELELTHLSGGGESRPLCVNVDSLESDHAVATRSEITLACAGLSCEYVDASAAFLAHEEQARHELWRPLLLALTATLMLEQGLACWFGRPRGARPASDARRGGAGAAA